MKLYNLSYCLNQLNQLNYICFNFVSMKATCWLCACTQTAHGLVQYNFSSGESKGGLPWNAPTPTDQKFLNYMQFFWENLTNVYIIAPPRVGAPS